MAQHTNVMISSTARDLPDHRKEVIDACQRQGMYPIGMEHLPASDGDAIEESLKMVDEAEIYLGIFAHRYGYVPAGYDISITEMEYNRAVERGIPRLIFLMHEDHRLKASDFETGEGAVKLKAFKDRLGTTRVAAFFKSPEDLRAHVIDSLADYRKEYRKQDLTVLHYVSDIPEPPEPYIAHPYTLLQMRDLVGREAELKLLTDWVAKPDAEVYQSRIFNVVAIGGMGKSALTWKWFNDIAPQTMKPLMGRMWWSFYESDASFENFITRALAYVSRQPREQVEKNSTPGEREDQLLAILNREPFLLVLDGIERTLIAYARMDANRLADDDLDRQTANAVAGSLGLPESAAASFTGQHRLRKTANPRVGNFLRKLVRTQASRVLVSTRLYPADLQNDVNGQPVPGSRAYFLRGMNDDDALSLWRAFGVSGSREELLSLFHTFENHPLLIQALASEIARYRRAPGDFDKWRSNNPDFDPFQNLIPAQAQSHVLSFALQGLSETMQKVLHTVAAFRMPASYDTLAALLIGADKTFPNDKALDGVLAELEDRGLLGWDRRANRYDLHPIVRGVIWSGLDDNARQGIYETLHAHFESVPVVDEEHIKSLEDLTPAIELYNTLIGLRRYDDAFKVFEERLGAMLMGLSTSRQSVEMLEALFPDGLDQLPRLQDKSEAFPLLTFLAMSYQYSGQQSLAALTYQRMHDVTMQFLREDSPSIREEDLVKKAFETSCILQLGLPEVLYLSGKLHAVEATVRRALRIEREENQRIDTFSEPWRLNPLGLSLAARGRIDEAQIPLQRALRILMQVGEDEFNVVVNNTIAQCALWAQDYQGARLLADRARTSAQAHRSERDYIRARRLQGSIELTLGNLNGADERFHEALTRARAINFTEEELPALIGLAELRRRQGEHELAREMLESVWEQAERGPYPMFQADAFNVLAQIERDAGNTAEALEAASKAYRSAWCDGPPFAYHWGLEAARKRLTELGAAEPEMPPFDESLYEPMVEVEINPPDEYGGRES
jgi:tetratricopeptide (TPR) repeat protein